MLTWQPLVAHTGSERPGLSGCVVRVAQKDLPSMQWPLSFFLSFFVFKMRAYAAAHFDFDQHLEVTWSAARAYLQSEYTGGESCAPMP